MARIKLQLPDKFIFSTLLEIRISDINYGGHLGNDSVLSLIHEARIRFLADKGFTEKNINGSGIIMTDTIIVYSAEGFYGEIIRIDVAVKDITSSGCDIFYKLTNNSNGKEIAKAKTGIAFFNYSTKRVTRTPQIFIETFKES